jgi:hypothetical protein
VAVVKAPAKHAAKARAQPVRRATALLHHAEMDHRASKAPRALKVRAMAAAKADATVDAAKNNVAIPVLTTVVMAKAVPHRAAHVLRAVVQGAAPKVAMVAAMAVAATQAAKTVVVTMATSCHATSIP